MKVFFSVGEPSGDVHGANLVRALRRMNHRIQAFGLGGPHMADAGCDVRIDLAEHAIIGLSRALAAVPKYFGYLKRADEMLRSERPDAVVLIDCPGFNWWVARRAKRLGIPVFYYSPPQIWAWARWRVRKMRRLVDHILCGLPFEETFWNRHGCPATYVGHPFFDEVRRHPLDQSFVAAERARPDRLVALLPGSRYQEVTSNMAQVLSAAHKVASRVKGVRFALACYKPKHAEYARSCIAADAPDLPIDVHVGRTPELMSFATCAIAVSGSVSLELLHHEVPTVIVYRLSPFLALMCRLMFRAKYITLVNLLADPALDVRAADRNPLALAAGPYPEYWSTQDESSNLALPIVNWLNNERQRQSVIARLQSLKEQYGQEGAAERAAEIVLDTAKRSAHFNRPRAHYVPPAANRAA